MVFFVLLALAGVYFFIPARPAFKKEVTVQINARAFARTISEETTWRRWWPKKTETRNVNPQARSFYYNNHEYTLLEKKLTSIVLSVKGKKDSLLTELFFIPLQADSVAVSWVGSLAGTANPIKKLQHFFYVKSMGNDIENLLQSLQLFYANEENLYNVVIKRDKVLDSTLISTSLTTTGYPSTNVIYSLIDKLQIFVKEKGALQTGYPMLNITTQDSATYLTRVALPVNKKLKNEGNIQYRWMLGRGNILVTEVKGGPYNIEKGFAEMEVFIIDNRRTAPAIPFQSLVTDRRSEPDTAKWITKLYWPVM